ncbi:hypothetical protein EJD97_010976, partial [Solanum chilense]
MEGKITFLNAELAAVADRERKRELEIAASKEEIFFRHVPQVVMMELIKRVMRMIRVIRRVTVITS